MLKFLICNINPPRFPKENANPLVSRGFVLPRFPQGKKSLFQFPETDFLKSLILAVTITLDGYHGICF